MRRTLLALTVLALTLAGGCAEPVPQPAAPRNDSIAPAAFAFTPRLTVAAKPNGQVEAFVDVSADGQTILTCLHGEFQRPSPMFASTDGGRTFRELPAAPEHLVGGDCEVAMGDDGWWYFLHSTVATETILATQDNGTTFQAAYVSAVPTNGMGDRPWLETVGPDLVLTYMPMSGMLMGQPGAIGVQRSTDHGKTWSQPQQVGGMEPDTLIVEGHPLVHPDGSVRIPLMRYPRPLEGPGVECRLSFALSSDNGATWTEEPVATPTCRPGFSGFPTTVAIAGDGTMYWAYYAPGEDGTDLLVITNQGEGWSGPVTLMTGLTSYDFGWADGRPDGTATLVMIANTTQQPDGGQLTALRLDARLADVLVASADLGHNSFVEYLAVDHDGEGRAHIVATNGDHLEYIQESLGNLGSRPMQPPPPEPGPTQPPPQARPDQVPLEARGPREVPR